MSNSGRSRRKLAEQASTRVELPFTTYIARQHDVDDTTTRNSDQGNAWPLNTPGAREAEGVILQLTPH